MSELRWKDLRDGDFESLQSLAESWDGYIKDMIAQAEAITEDVVKKHLSRDHYDSQTADDVREQAGMLADSWQDDLHEYAGVKIKATLEDAHEQLTAAQTDMRDLLDQHIEGKYKVTGPADDHGLEISESYAIDLAEFRVSSELMERAGVKESDLASDFGRGESHQRLLEAAEAEAADLAETLRAIMTRAHNAEEAAAAVLESMVDDPAEQPPKLGVTYDDLIDDFKEEAAERNAEFLRDLADDSEHSPQGVNDWWGNLSDDERTALIEDHPELVGPVDGIPVDARDEANRSALGNRIEGMDGDIASIEDRLAEMEANGEYLDNTEYAVLQEELGDLKDDRKLLGDLDDRIQDPNPDTGQDYYLLDFGTEGEGKAVVSVGNPDTADNVNVYVPGTGSDLGGAGHDDGGLMNRVDSMAHDASRYSPDDETATVLWLGYDAPDNVAPEATSPEYAEAASSDLNRFTDGIRATTDGEPANVTMTGHSYGSTTVGIAARDGNLEVDNMIFVGSPGVGVDSAAELGIDPDNIWASRNEADVIKLGMVHGADPTSTDFGGNTFISDATRPLDDNSPSLLSAMAPYEAAISNHSAYWDDENSSRKNMAYIVTGQEEGVK